MQETVTNANERKSLFSSFLEVLEIREKQAQADRQLQEEKYLRRTQRIYDFHERQRREAAELRRCLDYVSQHAHVLESVLRGAGAADAPLSACLLRQAAALQRCMAQCVANASRIRHLLAATHQPQMDTMLAKMVSIQPIARSFITHHKLNNHNNSNDVRADCCRWRLFSYQESSQLRRSCYSARAPARIGELSISSLSLSLAR